jgi:hypothetical protein
MQSRPDFHAHMRACEEAKMKIKTKVRAGYNRCGGTRCGGTRCGGSTWYGDGYNIP